MGSAFRWQELGGKSGGGHLSVSAGQFFVMHMFFFPRNIVKQGSEGRTLPGGKWCSVRSSYQPPLHVPVWHHKSLRNKILN